VKPAFWSDAKLANLRAPVRLFYIGLWMVADDAGYFRNDPAEIARDLYGYEPRAKRERNVVDYTTQLVEAERVQVFDCGHGVVPKMAAHQHLAAETKQVRTIATEHVRCIPQIPAITRESPPSKGKGNGDVMVSEGFTRPLTFNERVPRAAALGPVEPRG